MPHVRLLPILLLAVLTGCSAAPKTTPLAAGKCAADLAASDAAACWMWNDSLTRSALPDRSAPRRSILSGTDGAIVWEAAPGQ